MPFKKTPPHYGVWRSMKDRCLNPRNKHYAYYGGRGIKVCERWEHDYKTFADDMGDRPDGYSIDRIDTDGHYEPSNCRWADRQTQARNQRKTRYIDINGSRYKAADLSDISGFKTDTIIERAARGLSYEEVVSPDRQRDLSWVALGGKASGAKKRQMTHCKRGHEFTPENTRVTPEGWRACRQCHNAKMRRLNAAKSS